MHRYRVTSKRKHFYVCPNCALVYITAKALKSHYEAVHPTLSCDVVEQPPDPLEDEELDDLGISSNYIYKEDTLFPVQKPAQSSSSVVNDQQSVATIASTLSSTTNTNSSSSTIEIKLEDMEQFSNSSATKLITLNAPIEQAVGRRLDCNATTIVPVYAFQLQQPMATAATFAVAAAANNNNSNNNFSQNGQISTKKGVGALQIEQTVKMPSTAAEKRSERHKKYSCAVCNKSFSTIYNKRRHDEMFHNNAPTATEYKCSSCDKVFTSIYNKTRHENIHKPINERLKYKCIINNCNRGFTTQFILKMHIRKVHNMEVNF